MLFTQLLVSAVRTVDEVVAVLLVGSMKASFLHSGLSVMVQLRHCR